MYTSKLKINTSSVNAWRSTIVLLEHILVICCVAVHVIRNCHRRYHLVSLLSRMWKNPSCWFGVTLWNIDLRCWLQLWISCCRMYRLVSCSACQLIHMLFLPLSIHYKKTGVSGWVRMLASITESIVAYEKYATWSGFVVEPNLIDPQKGHECSRVLLQCFWTHQFSCCNTNSVLV